MSVDLMKIAADGARAIILGTESNYREALNKFGPDQEVRFPETAFGLPIAFALYGHTVASLGDIEKIFKHIHELLGDTTAEERRFTTGTPLDAGIAALLALEIQSALEYAAGWTPPEGYAGFLSDTIMRELGIKLVDGRIPGFAVLLGAPESPEVALKIVRDLQKRSIITFLVGSGPKGSMRDLLLQQKFLPPTVPLEEWWSNYTVPVGPRLLDAIFVLNWAVRSALTFGGLKGGAAFQCVEYLRERVNAFIIAFGEITPAALAAGIGAIALGVPIISDSPSTPNVTLSGVTKHETLVSEPNLDKIAARGIEVRGVPVVLEKIDLPVAYSAAFSGERVRKDDMHVQTGGKYSFCMELLSAAELSAIEDGHIEIIGPDLDALSPGVAFDLAFHVQVAGRKMNRDFEGILERQMHHWINQAQGIMHTGQRDGVWLRVSKTTFAAGFRLEHFGRILHAKLHEDFAGLADKVSVRLLTDKKQIAALHEHAKKVYAERDARIEGMTDESVDTFYSCTICQSYAPDHVCIITPERLGLCGAYNYLEGKAAYEIIPTGPNQPVKKDYTVNEEQGIWSGINDFVRRASHNHVESLSIYSMLQTPMTACGCFECIVAIMPEANGVIIVNREFTGLTPVGMDFPTLASSIGGGHQTPGFIGVGRLYLASKKFIRAEGGLARVVWMPKDLRESLREKLEQRSKDLGLEGFVDKIATEEDCIDSGELLQFLERVGHPALTMPPLI